MPYCFTCGYAVQPDASFCENCGTSLATSRESQRQVETPPLPPRTEYAAQRGAMLDDEVVVDMIGGLRRPVSLVKADSCVMVVTNRRMIIAQLTSQAMTDMAMQARERAKAEGKGFFGQWAEQNCEASQAQVFFMGPGEAGNGSKPDQLAKSDIHLQHL